MRFITATLSLLSLFAPAFSAPSPAEGALVPRTPGNVYVCAGENWTAPCTVLTVGLNNCLQLPEPYYSSLGSAGPDAGALCRIFDDSASGSNKCTGSGLDMLQNPGKSNLYTATSQPGYYARYISCVACSACT